MNETDSESALLGLIGIICIVAIAIIIIRIPIMIGKHRNISASDLSIVAILSWLGIIIGITWPIAFIMSLVYPKSEDKNTAPIYITNFSNNPTSPQITTETIDNKKYDKFTELEKLDDLCKRGILTNDEFLKQKDIILNHERN